MSDDTELLAAWRAGDQAAGSELFDRHFESLRRFFASKVGTGIEDLVLACGVEMMTRVPLGSNSQGGRCRRSIAITTSSRRSSRARR